MNFFIKTKTIKIIAIVLVVLMLFNFIVPRTVYAGLVDGIVNGILGIVFDLVKLVITGILKLFFWLFDALAVRFRCTIL